MKIASRLSLLALLLGSVANVDAQGAALASIPSVYSEGGVLKHTITYEYGTFTANGVTLTNTRLLNGIMVRTILSSS
jgi:hypothetical protein